MAPFTAEGQTLPKSPPLVPTEGQESNAKLRNIARRDDCAESPEPGAYVVRFDQGRGKFVYPDHAPFAEDELVLRICNTTPWKRYRLVFGSKTVGNDAVAATTVGYAATEVNAALRGANAILANDHTCADEAVADTKKSGKPDDKAAERNDLSNQCNRLRQQVTALVKVAQIVMERRDRAATLMAECGSLSDERLGAPQPPRAPGQRMTLDTVCAQLFNDGSREDPQTYDIGAEVNFELKEHGIEEQVVWLDDTWHVVERGAGPAAASLASNPGEGVLPPTIVGYLNTRAELINAIQRAMDGFSKLAALSLRVREDLARRQTTFRLGRFPGNRIVVATLEEHTLRIGFTQDRKHLQFSTVVVPHQLSLNVQKTSFVQFDVGVAFSTVSAPTYASRVQDDANGAPIEVVRKESDGRNLDPVIFASFLWCPQDLELPWIARTCKDGSRGFAWWAPRFAVGLPLSANLGRGSVYGGLSLPYIPYVSLIVGGNAQRVQQLAGMSEGDPVPSGGVQTSTRLKVGLFASVGVTEEIFYLLVPKTEAAK
ncbi:MAG: hypothetical protein ACOY0T_27585 [Myxococcota bacterium]